MTQIFISYSRKDLSFIERLAIDLEKQGFDVWYDLSDLEGGDYWNRAIQQAIQNSQYVILVLSPASVESKWVEKEFFFADKLNKKIIPLYYRPCNLGLAYVDLHYIEVHGEKYKSNFIKILSALDIRTSPVSIAEVPIEAQQPEFLPHPAREWIETNKITLSNGMEFMRVPAGKFLMGSERDNRFIEYWKVRYKHINLLQKDLDNDRIVDPELPQHSVDIPYDYYIARFPVTNDLYRIYKKPKDIKQSLKELLPDSIKKRNHPVTRISWNDVTEYCQWLSASLKFELPLGLVLRLPTEAEWEKASRGVDGREFPWGNHFDSARCNFSEGGKNGTTPVDFYSPMGDSPFGCADMIGNVQEWTHSQWMAYPYNAKDGRENEFIDVTRTIRSGTFFDESFVQRCAVRHYRSPYDREPFVGFRICLAPPLPK